MDFHSSPRRFSAYVLLCLCLMISISRGYGSQKLYIVYLGEKKHDDPSLVTASHHDMLTTILGSKEEVLASITYSLCFQGVA